uniref:hypothetical protein n=1 Tax=Sphingomonas populi TaxID=2484750 RepID=UPI0019CFF349
MISAGWYEETCRADPSYPRLRLDREIVHRHDKRLGARLRHARLRHNAAPEEES